MTTDIYEFIPGDAASGLLVVADHASARVPDDVDLGICPTVLGCHVAVDIGVDPLVRQLAPRLAAAAVLARVSRLVIDLNREDVSPGLIPLHSDGIEITGNHALDKAHKAARIERYHHAYHEGLSSHVERLRPVLLVSVHSFTPRLESRPEESRPWQVGVLYNTDDRAARIAIPLLQASGLIVGDNQPYSGQVLNYTMNRHGEGNGIPYLGLELRQDLIGTPDGVRLWADRLVPVIIAVRDALR